MKKTTVANLTTSGTLGVEKTAKQIGNLLGKKKGTAYCKRMIAEGRFRDGGGFTLCPQKFGHTFFQGSMAPELLIRYQ